MKGLLKEFGLEETKICTSTKTRIGCGKEKPIEDFKISSRNPNTGVIYRKSMCSSCEWKNEKKVQPIKPINTGSINVENITSMAWV